MSDKKTIPLNEDDKEALRSAQQSVMVAKIAVFDAQMKYEEAEKAVKASQAEFDSARAEYMGALKTLGRIKKVEVDKAFNISPDLSALIIEG